ncbi:MAG: hypothetical protein AAF913_14875 [Pseudomonadota bacterium]
MMTRLVLVPLLLMLAGAAAAEEVWERLANALSVDRAFSALEAACPADLLAGSIALPAGVAQHGVWSCGPDGAACLEFCKAGDPTACFDLGRVYQTEAPQFEASKTAAERLCAQACAHGSPLACTNRASAILRQRPGDPFALEAPEVAATCARRSFEMTCERESAWGCTMLGSMLGDGRGGPEDRDGAAVALRAACRIEGPGSAACDGAQSVAARLDLGGLLD